MGVLHNAILRKESEPVMVVSGTIATRIFSSIYLPKQSILASPDRDRKGDSLGAGSFGCHTSIPGLQARSTFASRSVETFEERDPIRQ
eukprot:scaffold1033_cov141-Skeletonema_marinoi.AAC.7